jgi:hypothetical protein
VVFMMNKRVLLFALIGFSFIFSAGAPAIASPTNKKPQEHEVDLKTKVSELLKQGNYQTAATNIEDDPRAPWNKSKMFKNRWDRKGLTGAELLENLLAPENSFDQETIEAGAQYAMHNVFFRWPEPQMTLNDLLSTEYKDLVVQDEMLKIFKKTIKNNPEALTKPVLQCFERYLDSFDFANNLVPLIQYNTLTPELRDILVSAISDVAEKQNLSSSPLPPQPVDFLKTADQKAKTALTKHKCREHYSDSIQNELCSFTKNPIIKALKGTKRMHTVLVADAFAKIHSQYSLGAHHS